MSEQVISAGGGEFLRVAMRMFSERERWHLTRVLMQAAQRSGRQVVDASPREADVIFVNPDESGARSFVKAGRARKRPLTVTYGSNQAVADALHLPKPAETRLVLPLLEKLEEQLSGLAGEAGPSRTESAAPPAPVPTRTFAGVISGLARASAEQKILRVQLEGETVLHVQPARGKVWIPSSLRDLDWESLCQRLADLDEADLAYTDPVELPDILEQGDHEERSLQELAWNLSFLSVPEDSPEPALRDKAVRVMRCPNFVRLPHERIHVTWSVRMMRAPMTLAQLMEQSPEDPQGAVRFYNACLMAGLLRAAGRSEMPSDGNSNTGHGSVISRIRTRLRSR
jgi:hypothetical protein